MSESTLGFEVTSARQNAGSFAYCCIAAPRPPPGAVNAPAGTIAADVTVALGSASFVSASHDAANTGLAGNEQMARRTAVTPKVPRVMHASIREANGQHGRDWKLEAKLFHSATPVV